MGDRHGLAEAALATTINEVASGEVNNKDDVVCRDEEMKQSRRDHSERQNKLFSSAVFVFNAVKGG